MDVAQIIPLYLQTCRFGDQAQITVTDRNILTIIFAVPCVLCIFLAAFMDSRTAWYVYQKRKELVTHLRTSTKNSSRQNSHQEAAIVLNKTLSKKKAC